jgi:PAS domain S-box-containing protein
MLKFGIMRDISCRTTNIFIQYVNNTRPEFLQPLLEGLPYDKTYLSNPDNWIPWDIERILEDRLARLFNDDEVMFKIGRSGMSLKSMGIINILSRLFTTPEHLIRTAPKFSRYFTKDIVHINILQTTKESATVEIKIKGRQTRGACLYTQGILTVFPEFFGLEPAVLTEIQCVIPQDEIGAAAGNYPDTVFGAESCIYHLKWKNRMGGFINAFARKKMTMKEAFRHLEESHAKLQIAYEEIRRSEEKYRDLMENASDVICFLDSNGAITSLNRKGVGLSGYRLEEIIGRDFSSLLEDASQREFLSRFRESMKGATDIFELVFRKRDGGRLMLSINPNPIRDGNNITGIMLIARDITQEREIASRLLEAERFAAKGMVAAEIAHEINNSLANIETGLFIINNIHTDRRYRQDMLKDIYEEIDRMSGIVKGILEVYRQDDSAVQNIDLNSEIDKIIAITRRRLKGKGISVVSRLSPDLPTIPCYPGHIKQILLNLIKNAEEAMRLSERKQISVATEEEDNFVKLKVSDTGCGVSEDMKKHLFTPFVTSKAGSTGLGLSICREIAERYGGDIRIESAQGKGAVVILSLRKNRYG